MHFENLWALLLLPLVFLPFWLKGRQGQLYSWLAIAPQDRFSDIANLLLKIITSLLILCLVLAMAAPRGADQEIQKSGKGAQSSWRLTAASAWIIHSPVIPLAARSLKLNRLPPDG